ncbi:hypothetical protein GTC6_11151 [Gordonia terrae C-6]|uniref:Lipoprotein n=2 Tax=Gordonia TaxID=2053 RepID=R7Y9B9_9ACTN|nr:hypothetical protein GTC6_11151 [Gordonia terrae C-6]
MFSRQRAAMAAATMLAGIVVLGLASCGLIGENGAATDDPVVEYGLDGTGVAPWSSRAPATGTSSAATPPRGPAIGQPGVHCGWVSATADELPVVVLSGQVDCVEAMTVTQRYFDSISRAHGQDLALTVNGWSCLRATVPGWSYADSYYMCAATANVGTVRIGW